MCMYASKSSVGFCLKKHQNTGCGATICRHASDCTRWPTSPFVSLKFPFFSFTCCTQSPLHKASERAGRVRVLSANRSLAICHSPTPVLPAWFISTSGLGTLLYICSRHRAAQVSAVSLAAEYSSRTFTHRACAWHRRIRRCYDGRGPQWAHLHYCLPPPPSSQALLGNFRLLTACAKAAVPGMSRPARALHQAPGK